MTVRGWRWRGSVALMGVALAFVLVPFFTDVINSDWPAFATGGRLIISDPAHLYDFDTQRRVELDVTHGRVLVTLGISGILPFLAPAWVALLAAPFDALGTETGGKLWILFGLACLALGLYLAVRPRAPSLILPAFSSIPTALMLLNAQLDGIVVLGIGAAIALWRRPYYAGLALGLTLVKPQLVLPLGVAMIVTTQWRVLAGWATAGTALLAVTAAFNPRWVLQWLPALSSPVTSGSREVDLAHFGTVAPGAAQGYAVALLSLAGLVAVLWLARSVRGDFNAAGAILVAGGVLVAPHALPSDLVLVALALVVWGRATWREWVLLSAGALIAALAPPPVPAAVGVLLTGYLLVRFSGLWRRAPAPASAG